MTTKNDISNLFTCPRCGSGSTQTVELAHARSVRTGTSGETISRFGESIAPPPAKDETFVPYLAVCGTMIAGMIWIPDLLPRLGFSSFAGLSPFSRQVLLVSAALGLLVGLTLATRAIKFNVFVRPHLLEEWARGAICNRCGLRFEQAPTEALGSRGETHDS